MTEAQRIETTYADLRPTDLVIDKAGNAWPIAELKLGTPIPEDDVEIMTVDFWLCDPVTKVKMHSMTKRIAHSVTVSRVLSQADEAAKLEDEIPAMRHASDMPEVDLSDDAPSFPEQLASLKASGNYPSIEDALANVKAELDAEVVVEYTAEEYYAAEEANEDAPLRPPPFADMTPLEQRSHLYLFHGVIAYDLKSAEELKVMHEQAHAQQEAGTLQSAYIPHTHDGKF